MVRISAYALAFIELLRIQQKDNIGWDRLDYFTGMALIYSAFVSKIKILRLSLPKGQEPLLGAL